MEELNPQDYLINQEGIDWQTHLKPWQHLLPNTFTIWIVNKFGDLFLIAEDDSLHHLDIQLGTLTKRGTSKQDFLEQMLEDQNAADWLYINYVDAAEIAGIELPQGHCYAFKVPPVLSGEYVLGNICTMEIGENFKFLADVHAQIKDLPDGSTVTLNPSES